METSIREPARDRAIRLFTYLKELSELRAKTIRSVDRYEHVVWLADIPHEPGCQSASWFDTVDATQLETWVEIQKPPALLTAPPPPETLTPWLNPEDIGNSKLEFPTLADQIDEIPDDAADTEQDESASIKLADHPEIQDLWDDYVQRRWIPWATEDRRVQRIQAVYTELFAMYQRQQRLGEQYEVVVGLGLLTWKTPQGQVVRRHLVTAQTSLAFDPVRGTMSVGPAGDGAQLTLEQDMIEAQDRPDGRVVGLVEQTLAELGDDPWQPGQLETIFSAWAHAASSQGRYEESAQPSTEVNAGPVVFLAPAIILRLRTERSLIRTFQDIMTQLETGADLPIGVRRLVEMVDDANPAAPDGRDAGQTLPDVEDVYFPLPANDEQLEIISRLHTRQGVLVQGPPGTGKSHTIANLVAHLLATGQRVLVTSHTPRALRVLREKIPAEIADLCVSLLGDDRIAMQSLEDSVHGITDRYNRWDPRRNANDIEVLVQQLDAARRSEATTSRRLLEIRERETYRHSLPFSGYEGTATAIARRLADEASSYDWIGVQPEENEPPPLTGSQALTLLALLRHLTPERRMAARRLAVASADVPRPDEFAALVQAEAGLQQRAAALEEHQSHPAFSALRTANSELRAQISETLAHLHATVSSLRRQPEPWVGQATTHVLAGRASLWRQLRTSTVEHLTAVEGRDRTVGHQQILGLAGRDRRATRSDASALLAHLESGKRLGFGPMRAEAVKRGRYLLTEVTVDGHPCDQVQPLRDLIAWLDVAEHLDALDQQWTNLATIPKTTAVVQVAAYQDLVQMLDQVLALSQTIAEMTTVLDAASLFVTPAWHDDAEVVALLKVAEAASVAVELEAAAGPLSALTSKLRNAAALSGNESLEVMLGAVIGRDVAEYTAAYERLRQLEGDRESTAVLDSLLENLRAVRHQLVEEVAATPTDSIWDERFSAFEAAWDWARADAWLVRMDDPVTLERLTTELAAHRRQIQATIRDLVAAKAWGQCFRTMTESERQHLMAWMQAVRRVGKGTGKYAAQHRRSARVAMDGCRSAIPAWIMPIYRVAETVRPGTDAFDVVIVDEASQSGPEALFLHYIAKKIIVVGDDKQISPEFVGLNREDVNALRARHIADLPFNESLGVDNSFFDQAVIRYGGRIRLREHFRCMPEIIQFSNNLTYQSEPLIPLRQYGADRLDPVKVTHVRDGYRSDNDRNVENRPEAEAIVAQIVACCADPAYDGKSMGVISLQGKKQAELIEELLSKALDPEEVEARQIVCGDAYAFQGDERDVIFLSLVAARRDGHRIGPLTSARDERRFNVAASRARDQMWLFHTATLQELSPNCLRHRLLEYCLSPQVEPLAVDGLAIARGELDPRFDSLFEQEVFHIIQDRGYRVRPQVEVAGYRIDLVVEGMRGRLAVECDGERWHGPDRYEADMARQRQLERCGWTFWRVRGGTFYRDPQQAMSDLWTTLDHLGIYPSVAAEKAVTLEERRSPDVVGSEDAPSIATAPFPIPAVSTPAEPDEVVQTIGSSDLSGQAGSTIGGGDDSDVVGSPPPAIPMEHPPSANGALDLEPYRFWTPQALPNPNTASLDDVLGGLSDIIAAEGPMPCLKAYHRYLASIGVASLSPQVRSIFNKAVYRGIQQRRLIDRNELGTPGQIDNIVRLAGTPPVVLRERGDRTLDEIPPSEVNLAMYTLAEATGRGLPAFMDEVYRDLLLRYGLERIPASDWQNRILERVMGLADAKPLPAAKNQLALFLPADDQ